MKIKGVKETMPERRPLVFSLAIILLISFLAAGCGSKPENTETGKKATPVEVVKAEKGALVETSTVTGKLGALVASDVVPGGAGGKVESVKVAAGDRVQKGQTLVVLENTALAARVRQAQQAVVQAETGLELAKMAFEKAKADYQRAKVLFEQGAIPKAGTQGFESIELNYKSKEQQLKQAESGLESARAGLTLAQENYANSFIKAPISGVVTAVNVDPGEMAGPASPVPVVSVANLNKVVVEATVSEDLVNELKNGDEVEVTVSAASPQPYKGKITTIAPAADKTAKAFPVEVQLDNPKGILKPGMFAEIHFTQKHNGNIVLPREAVTGSGGEYFAWVVEDGKAVQRQVRLGRENGEAVAVLSGLQEGETVVTVGAGALREGMPVEIQKQGK